MNVLLICSCISNWLFSSQQEDALEVTEIMNGTQFENDRTEPEIRNEEPEANFSGQASTNLTTTAGNKGAKSKDSEKASLLSNEASLRSLNISANGPSSDIKVETRNDTKETNVGIEEFMKGEDSGEIVEEAAAPSAAQNISNGLASEGGKSCFMFVGVYCLFLQNRKDLTLERTRSG